MSAPDVAQRWLSVVMPVYNGEAHLAVALESVAVQAEGVACIVVDDGSSDNSVKIARSFSDRMALTVVPGARRGNWVAATNDGLRLATSPYVCFLHQDDVWLAGRAQRMKRLVEAFPHASLWVQSAQFMDAAGRPAGRWRLPVAGADGLVASEEFVRRLLVQNFLCIASPVFRRDGELGGGSLHEDLWYTADWDFWLRLAARGEVAFDRAAGVAFRLHPQSQTSTRTAASDDMRAQLERPLERHLAAWQAGRPEVEQQRLERTARAAIDLNVALAAASHGDRRLLWRAVRTSFFLGPRDALELLRSSRLVERVAARVRTDVRARMRQPAKS